MMTRARDFDRDLAAEVTVPGVNQLPPATRRVIADWLHRQADLIEQGPNARANVATTARLYRDDVEAPPHPTPAARP